MESYHGFLVVAVTMVGILGSWQSIQLPSSAPSYHTITLACLILIVVIMAVFVNNLFNQSIKHLRKLWNDTAVKQGDDNNNNHVDINDPSTFVIRTPYEHLTDGWKQLRLQMDVNYAVIWVSSIVYVFYDTLSMIYSRTTIPSFVNTNTNTNTNT